MTNPPEILRDRGRSLEDEFFRREDKRLMEHLATLRAAEATREALGRASGITKPAVLDKLIELGIRAETVAALSIVPLVEVAWADGGIDAKERGAVVERAGVPEDSTAGALLAASARWRLRPAACSASVRRFRPPRRRCCRSSRPPLSLARNTMVWRA